MAVPRPVLIAILGMGLVFAALLATRNAGQGGEAEVAPATPVKKPAAVATPAKEEPKQKSTEPSRERPATKPEEKKAPAAEEKKNGSQPAQAQPTGDSRQAEVARAIESDKVVVLLISRGGAADDTAVRTAVESLEESHRGRIAVFTDGIQNLPVYQPLLNRVNVAQLPSIVIVRPGRRARLLEGYVDKASLRQHVTDALR